MNKLLERKKLNNFQNQSLQDNFMNNNYYEPSYNGNFNNYNNQNISDYNTNYYYNQQYTDPVNYTNQSYYYNNLSTNDYNNPQQDSLYTQYQGGYVRPTEQYVVQEQSVKKTKNNKKTKLNTKAKLLIGVYFFIVAVIATLLLVNMTVGGTTVSADGDDFISINEESINTYINSDGEKITLNSDDSIIDYNYDLPNNWFDDMCDNLSNKVGK